MKARDLPLAILCYGLAALLAWMLFNPWQFRALVLGALEAIVRMFQ